MLPLYPTSLRKHLMDIASIYKLNILRNDKQRENNNNEVQCLPFSVIPSHQDILTLVKLGQPSEIAFRDKSVTMEHEPMSRDNSFLQY